MTRKFIVWTTLLALAGCAPAIPPAPVLAPESPAPTFLPPVEISSSAEAAADSALNDLVDAAPDAKEVPAFESSDLRWDMDVQTFTAHPRVQYYLDYFQGVSREGMTVFLERGARYEGMIRERFEAEGLPGDLGYLALIESGYSNQAVSRAHAVGMWQFMRGTARGYGLRVDTWVDERRDPVKATEAAARHLRKLRERFGSLYLAAAAYNAGAGKVSRSLGKLEWDVPADTTEVAQDDSADVAEDEEIALEELIESTDASSDAAFFRLAGARLLASETQNYVPKLIAAAVIAKQPERFGITPPLPTPFTYDSLVVTAATGLDVVANLAEVGIDDIKDLNPQYLRLATPPRTTSVIRLPAGTGEKVAERYLALPPSERVHFLTHVVRPGERLGRIAARYHLRTEDVRAANPRVRPSRLRVGSRLVIPAVAVPSALAIRATGKAAGIRGGTRVATHRVRSGETLIGIARRYRVSLRALRRVNALPVEYTLKAGKRLRIPS
jgi:membrane-bound lytic murein transglycosylase D